MIHVKLQALFSSKNKSKQLKCRLLQFLFGAFTPEVPEKQIAKFANSVDLDEVAHNEPPHLDPHCLPTSL